jgi:nucleotide-binding universal stress UspA family protein
MPRYFTPSQIEYFLGEEHDKRTILEAELSQMAATSFGNNIRYDVSVVEGHPDQLILNAIRTRKPDLLVMESHGRKGFQRLKLESVTETMTSEAPCPLLIIKHTEKQKTESRSI